MISFCTVKSSPIGKPCVYNNISIVSLCVSKRELFILRLIQKY